MENTYEKAYTEVLEILRFLPGEEYDKIPQEEIHFYESHKDPNYTYHFDPAKGLNEQLVSREANAILVSIFREFFASDLQKEKVNQMLVDNEQRHQAKKVAPYKKSIFAKLRAFLRATFCHE